MKKKQQPSIIDPALSFIRSPAGAHWWPAVNDVERRKKRRNHQFSCVYITHNNNNNKTDRARGFVPESIQTRRGPPGLVRNTNREGNFGGGGGSFPLFKEEENRVILLDVERDDLFFCEYIFSSPTPSSLPSSQRSSASAVTSSIWFGFGLRGSDILPGSRRIPFLDD